MKILEKKWMSLMKKLNLNLFNFILLLLFINISFSNGSGIKSIYGKAEVIDGDTIKIKGKKIRFFGIDAPEVDQVCFKSSNPYHCGHTATKALIRFTKNRTIYCYYTELDKYKRILGTCNYGDGKEDINALMVSLGYAVAYTRYSKKYLKEEENAKHNKDGLWEGTFERPEEWRKKNK